MKSKQQIKDSISQKNINKFYGSQIRRQNHEATKANSKITKGASKGTKTRNKRNTN